MSNIFTGINVNIPGAFQPVGGPNQVNNETKVGGGVNGKQDGVPDVIKNTYGAMLESLSALMPAISGDDMDVLLLQVTVEMKNAEQTSQKEKIETDQSAKRSALQEKQGKLDEAQKKMEEAIEKKESASIWDKIKLAFEWLGAVLAVVAAAVAIATGVGAGVGALLLTAAVATIIMAIDSTVQAATGQGMMGHAVLALGGTKEQAGWADMGFKIGLGVVAIATSIAGGIGAAKAVSDTALMSMQMAKMITTVSDAIQATSTVLTAAGDITTGVIKYEAGKEMAEAKDKEAEGKEMEALVKALDDLIDQALARLMQSNDRFAGILDSIADAIQDRGNSVAKVKFGK